jgi:hypothetical protein
MIETLAHNSLGEDDLGVEEAQELLISGGIFTVEKLDRRISLVGQSGSA